MSYMGTDDPTLTHLLGFLTPAKWADAQSDEMLDQDTINELIEMQSKTYLYNLQAQIDELKEEKRKKLLESL